MPELPDSTPPDDSPASPSSPLSKWERFEGFRFTFLLHFSQEEQAALQRVAHMLFDAVLERPRPDDLPEEDGPWLLWEVRTALAEMAYLEGYLGTIFEAHRVSSLSPALEKLSRMAGGIAHDLSEVKHTFDQGLTKWERKHKRGSR